MLFPWQQYDPKSVAENEITPFVPTDIFAVLFPKYEKL